MTEGRRDALADNTAAGDLVTGTVLGAHEFMKIIPPSEMPTATTVSIPVTMACAGAA